MVPCKSCDPVALQSGAIDQIPSLYCFPVCLNLHFILQLCDAPHFIGKLDFPAMPADDLAHLL
ncbi:Uncharacterised protein [Mycobacteroides abscessus subsp. abscessus]|nr:Uncharacterised protein [Mycobacteroides abscessus subsp. abscessus]